MIHTKKSLCRFLVITDIWCEFQVSSSMRILVSHRNVSVLLCRMPCRSLWAHSPSVLLLQKSFAEVFPTSRARPPWRLSRQSRSRTAAAASPTFKCQTAALPDTRASLPVSITPDGVLSDLMWLEQTNLIYAAAAFRLNIVTTLLALFKHLFCSAAQQHDRLCNLLLVIVWVGFVLFSLAALPL